MKDGQPEQPGYVSYLMRLWRAPVDGGHTWRASLEEPHTRKIYHFKELSSLFAFLQAQTGYEVKGDGLEREIPLPPI